MCIWVFPKIMVPPNHPFVHRVFHYFHHPFWGITIFGNAYIFISYIYIYTHPWEAGIYKSPPSRWKKPSSKLYDYNSPGVDIAHEMHMIRDTISWLGFFCTYVHSIYYPTNSLISWVISPMLQVLVSAFLPCTAWRFSLPAWGYIASMWVIQNSGTNVYTSYHNYNPTYLPILRNFDGHTSQLERCPPVLSCFCFGCFCFALEVLQRSTGWRSASVPWLVTCCNFECWLYYVILLYLFLLKATHVATVLNSLSLSHGLKKEFNELWFMG